MSKGVVFRDNFYQSKKKFGEMVKDRLNQNGITKSIKNKSNDDFLFFIELCKRHPNHEDKLNNMIDFEIKPDSINKKVLTLHIIKSDNTTIDISIPKCVSGKSSTDYELYNRSLRTVINPQIQEYKKANKNITNCPICNKILNYDNTHVDHIIHFAKLVDDFTKINKIKIPSKYDQTDKNTKCFTQKDKHIGLLFYDYHFKNADLRIICDTCNLTRKNYKF